MKDNPIIKELEEEIFGDCRYRTSEEVQTDKAYLNSVSEKVTENTILFE